MELITSVAYKSQYISMNAGDDTAGKGIPELEKTRMLADFPQWFTEYTALKVAADVAEAAADVAEGKAAASLAATTVVETEYLALKAISDADATAATDARTAADVARAAANA